MGINVRLSQVAVRTGVRTLIRPALRPRVPNAFRRRWLDVCSVLTSVPRGTEVRPVRLGDVPGLRAPEHPYPAALRDTLAAYRVLQQSGYLAERIVLAGDSAGAGLAVATALALRDEDEPLPVALALLSPWLDLTLSGDSMTVNASRDAMLHPAWPAVAADEYRAGREVTTPGISPLYAELTGLPPMDIQAAENDLIVSDADREADAALSDLGLALARRWEDHQEPSH